MKTLTEDLFSPLNEVERKWIRKPFTILLTPVVFIVVTIVIVFTDFPPRFIHWWKWTWFEFTIKCYKGEKDT